MVVVVEVDSGRRSAGSIGGKERVRELELVQNLRAGGWGRVR